MIMFKEKINIRNCSFKSLNIYGAYFLNGFSIINNLFDDILQLMHSSHGAKESSMILNKNSFRGFVDFEDVTFNTSIEILDNDFSGGSNLLTMGQLKPEFLGDCQTLNNTGNLKVSKEQRSRIYTL